MRERARACAYKRERAGETDTKGKDVIEKNKVRGDDTERGSTNRERGRQVETGKMRRGELHE